MKKLSNGLDSTVGNWHALCEEFFGPESKATAFLKGKMEEQGPDMEVVADEKQLLHLLVRMVINERGMGTDPEAGQGDPGGGH